ncbi:MAG: ATP-binding cassette domain-containing protein [Thermoleophilia bacterium]|nr:ATP-binding cassette domain-containing protein [Thermoleophilia bacterium]
MKSNNGKILKMQEVSRIFGKGTAAVKAIDGVSLGIETGEIVLIMGPSGSGKTTLLSMAGGLLKPTSGEVFVAGKNLSELDARSLSQLRLRRVGFVFQAFNLLGSLTALENVVLAKNLARRTDKAAETDSKAILDRLGLGQRLAHVPADLSGGEKQRVAIARALVNDPPLILADEPTGNLDSHSGREVMMLLFDLAREEGRSVVVVSHDPRIVDIADRVLWLEDGRLSTKRSELEEKVRDPVCGMQMDIKDVAFTAIHHGQVYHFCSEKCRQKFLEDSGRFT